MRFVIVTGVSGAGKSTVLKMLEDAHYFCVDNLPIPLIEKFAELALGSNQGLSNQVALGIDIRSGQELPLLDKILERWRTDGIPFEILFLDASETAIMANAQSFIFWNSVFYIPLAVLIIYRYTIQGLGYSGLAMFAGVAEMVARAMVGFWFVPLWGYFAACIASPVAWFFACFFLIPAYIVVRKRLQNEKQADAQQAARA